MFLPNTEASRGGDTAVTTPTAGEGSQGGTGGAQQNGGTETAQSGGQTPGGESTPPGGTETGGETEIIVPDSGDAGDTPSVDISTGTGVGD
jgi:hypothetical protein